MFHISRFVGRSTVPCIRHSNSLQNLFIGVRPVIEKYKRSMRIVKVSLVLFASHIPITMLLLDDDDDDDYEEMKREKETINKSTIPESVKKSCDNFLNSTMDFLNIISNDISDSAFQYKTALIELCSCLEKYAVSKEFAAISEELEDEIISARSKVYDCERKYLELTTVTKSVEKVTCAISELSFLLREETLALKLKDTLNSLLEKIEFDLIEINSIKRKLFKIGNNEINTGKKS